MCATPKNVPKNDLSVIIAQNGDKINMHNNGQSCRKMDLEQDWTS